MSQKAFIAPYEIQIEDPIKCKYFDIYYTQNKVDYFMDEPILKDEIKPNFENFLKDAAFKLEIKEKLTDEEKNQLT